MAGYLRLRAREPLDDRRLADHAPPQKLEGRVGQGDLCCGNHPRHLRDDPIIRHPAVIMSAVPAVPVPVAATRRVDAARTRAPRRVRSATSLAPERDVCLRDLRSEVAQRRGAVKHVRRGDEPHVVGLAQDGVRSPGDGE